MPFSFQLLPIKRPTPFVANNKKSLKQGLKLAHKYTYMSNSPKKVRLLFATNNKEQVLINDCQPSKVTLRAKPYNEIAPRLATWPSKTAISSGSKAPIRKFSSTIDNQNSSKISAVNQFNRGYRNSTK